MGAIPSRISKFVLALYLSIQDFSSYSGTYDMSYELSALAVIVHMMAILHF